MDERDGASRGAIGPGLEHDQVVAQLRRILASRGFARAPVLRRFLEHVVHRALAGKSDQLKEYAIGVDVFDRGEAFDPRVDTIVRVEARRLRARLRDYYEAEGAADPVRIELPTGHYVPEFGTARGPLPPSRGTRGDGRAGRPPAARNRLIGREGDLEALGHLLVRDDARLVTLTGPGGSGKTRLGLEAVRRLGDAFPGGVLFLALASVTTADAAVAALARELRVRRTEGRPIADALAEAVRRGPDGRRLLFLDNFEHVIDAAPVLGSLLEASMSLHILVTSRAALRLAGEREYPVAPLPLPARTDAESPEALSRNPAVALFVERATALKPDLELSPQSAAPIAEICRRLDGLPLAIELAAARIKLFSTSEIRDGIEAGLDFLAGGPRDVPDRQQTLRKTIDWSHGLLSGPEKALFRRLSVFRGGWTLEGAEAVCDARGDLGTSVTAAMTSLLDESLVERISPDDAEARFSTLETLREYALERLAESGEVEETRRAHAAWCLVLAEEGSPRQAEEWLSRCELEHDNFRAALDWLIERGEAAWALRMVLALFPFWDYREHSLEGRARTEAVLALPGADAPTRWRASALQCACALSANLGEPSENLGLGALEIFRELGDRRGVASLLGVLGTHANLRGELAASRSWYEQSLEACREIGDPQVVAGALGNLADVLRTLGDHDLARDHLEEALRLRREANDWRGVGWALNQLGDVALARGDVGEARERYEEGAELFRSRGDALGLGRSLADLGRLECQTGSCAAAARLFREALSVFAGVDYRRGVARVLEGFAALAAREGRSERALTLAGAADSLRRDIGAPRRVRDERRLGQALEELSPDPGLARRARARGERLPFAEAIRCALDDG